MTFVNNRNFTATGVLAADVANSGTFTVAYPTGSAQTSFTSGLHGTDSYIMINGNDKWTVAGSKMSLNFGASNITVTNNSGVTWPAGSSFFLNLDQVDNNARQTLSIPVNLAAISGAGDVVTEIRPGIAGTIEAVEFLVTERATTASKAATLNLEIGTTDVTGGALALTTTNCGTLGASVAGTTITANNTLTRDSLLSVEAASVTAFSEGRGVLLVHVRRTPLD
jgi:hypothetical protein